MTAHFKYLKYLVRHKWYVAKACFRHGLYWRGLKHDWSKFLPSEWFPYAESFYGIGTRSDEFEKAWLDHAHREGVTIPYGQTKAGVRKAFDRAWLHHQHWNPHHWQHWVLHEDSGATKILEMPVKDAIEMYCDWEGAGLAITGKKDVASWYEKNQGKMLLHSNTRAFVESLIYSG